MVYGIVEKPASGTEGNGGCMPAEWEAVDFFHKYVLFLVCNATWRPRFSANLLQLRCSFGTMGLGLNGGVS
jgi:hypothetical protein